MLAGRDIEADAFRVVHHDPVGTAIDPAGLWITGDVEAPRADIAAAIVRIPERSREFRHVDVIVLEDVFEDRAVTNDLVRDGLKILGMPMVRAREFELVEMFREAQRQVLAGACEPVDEQAEAFRTAIDLVEYNGRSALVVAHDLNHLANVSMPVDPAYDLEIAHLLDRHDPVAQILVF